MYASARNTSFIGANIIVIEGRRALHIIDTGIAALKVLVAERSTSAWRPAADTLTTIAGGIGCTEQSIVTGGPICEIRRFTGAVDTRIICAGVCVTRSSRIHVHANSGDTTFIRTNIVVVECLGALIVVGAGNAALSFDAWHTRITR